MAELKTKENDASVEAFLASIPEAQKQRESKIICKLMQEITGEKPKMWGSSIVGFGTYHYQYASGREGDWMIIGFSPRKAALTLYIMNGYTKYQDLLAHLGKYSTGKACLYIKKLEDVDMSVLTKLIALSVKHIKQSNP